MRRDHPPPGREIATSRRAAHITAQHRADATAGALHPSSRPRRGTRCLGLRRRLVPDDRDPPTHSNRLGARDERLHRPDDVQAEPGGGLDVIPALLLL